MKSVIDFPARSTRISPREVALGAYAVASRSAGSRSGIDDVRGFSARGVAGRARAMTSFAAYSAFKERRQPIAVLSPADGLHSGCVAFEAGGSDGSGKKRICCSDRSRAEGAHAPVRRVICGGRFIQKAIYRDQIAPRGCARSDEVRKFAALGGSCLRLVFGNREKSLWS